jgi:ElaA protein
MLQSVIKTFNDLSPQDIYNILQLRSEVFVVEQNCVYQDIDDKDQYALHLLLKKDDYLIGYSRIFKAGDYFKEASIGRVLVKKEDRNNRHGSLLMELSIKAIKDHFKENTVKISAQTYLKKFYNELGFDPVGEEYLEDGIPHIAMLLN